MLVSWDWLSDYVRLDASIEQVTERLTLSGLNLESIADVGGDVCIDLEVTSNRPDCLGHIGVAREAAVLFDRRLNVPQPEPPVISERTADITSVALECPDLCPQYMARVVRGVTVGPSPDWLKKRLTTVGIATINNVVDITNYVLLECGQPLHAFDFDRLRGRRIVVRRARAGEKLVAINQKEYELAGEMCVIADAERPVAIGGVMGGLETEIGPQTSSILVETASFAPISIRHTARQLNLHSDSSYRFERALDPLGLDWASRRCCELILDLAGGELLSESVVTGSAAAERPAIRLRFDQIERILGIKIPRSEVVRILTALDLTRNGEDDDRQMVFVPPSWRRDLTHEIDLIEEAARIHGYEQIPEDVAVPLTASAKSLADSVSERIRRALTGAGFSEAYTLSFVSDEQADLFAPRGEIPRLAVEHSSRRHENVLRQSLIPSLLVSRRHNERHGTFDSQLFEIAKVYLGADPDRPESETEPRMLGLVSGRPFADVKGVIETLADRLNHAVTLDVKPSTLVQFAPGRGAEVLLDDQPWGWLGELDARVTEHFNLRDAVTVAELSIDLLAQIADLSPQFEPLPQYQAVTRELSLVLDETVAWSDLAAVIRRAAGPLLEAVSFGGQYRGKQIGGDKKSYIAVLLFRSPDRTLTGEEVERAQQAVIEACGREAGATVRT